MQDLPRCTHCGYNEQGRPLRFRSIELADSRLLELLNSNDPPLRTEHLQLDSFIDEGHGFFATLQERVSQARVVLHELLEEEKRVKDIIESCQTIVSPIRRIPEDIICEIFLACWETEGEIKDSLNGKFAPFVLSKVCREWRSIALSTSRLWSTISLDFDLYRNDSMECQYLLQMLLSRSTTRDIILSVHSNKEITKNHLMPILLMSAPRWTDVSISIPYLSLHAFSAARGYLHRLKHLHVDFIRGIARMRIPLSKPVFDAFEYAPLLRSLSFPGVFNVVQQTNLPWSQLTKYTGHDWTSTYLEIFKLAPDMEAATLQCADDSEEDVPLPSSYSSHKHLRTLHLHEDDDSVPLPEGGIARFLSHVEFPALQSLTMEYAHLDIRIPSYLCGSTAGSLKSLIIDALFCIPAEGQTDLLDLLKTTPSLSRLSISCQCMPEGNDSEGIFLGLNANMNPALLPCLTSLDIWFINPEPYLEPSFVEMIQSRRYPTPTRAALETLRLSSRFTIISTDNETNVRWKDIYHAGLVMYGCEE
ncbi:hypothetical protein IW261DRAFT_1365103 [Armillaria novae-zelandiae]|uniref:F-box domain-containing protein n=1 Tax=Armillaria novae-zelandiae TaxID=153914 RepID=A0AA39U7Y9_9AGAR|nr:hypothetical protein IW261DRAFT_1365103 [Armillaria novae-zelandiae]